MDSHQDIVKIYTSGSCMNFYCILHAIFPEAKPYYNMNHVITEIDGRYYDITGHINKKSFEAEGYLAFSEFHDKKGMSRAFRQMINYRYK